MGLDMYLHRKIYVGNKWQKSEQQVRIVIPETNEEKRFSLNEPINQDKIAYIEEEAGYWRKANQIHQWFVDNVQNGTDDCKEYYVDPEDMKKLLEIINKVLDASELIDGEIHNGTQYTPEKGEEEIIEQGKVIKDPTVAKELLPTQEGFFFGGYEYDQYYYNQLVETKKIIEEALKYDHSEFYYQSSW